MRPFFLICLFLSSIGVQLTAQTISNTYKGIFIGNARQAAIDMTNMDQSGATVGGVPTWDGTHWVPELGVGIQVAAGPGLIASTNGNVVTISTNGTSGGGGGANVGAGTNVTAQTNVVGSVTNVIVNAASLGVNPQYFTLTPIGPANTSNFLSFIPQNQSVDTRPLVDSDIKGAFPASNVLINLFTNSGGCTIRSIRVDWIEYTNSIWNGYDQPILSIWDNGQSNGCQELSFLAAQGQPLVAFHGDTIDLNSTYILFQGSGFGGQRDGMFVNSQSNGSVSIKFPFWNAVQLWSDVIYSVGAVVVTNSWHMIEKQQMTANGTTFTISPLVSSVGQLESLYMFGEGNIQGYLESRPSLYLDGNLIQANGTEDFFGGSWYWNGGIQPYATPQWGTIPTFWLHQLYGFTYANDSYRFFQGAYFNSTLLANYTNLSGVSISNDFLMTYITTP